MHPCDGILNVALSSASYNEAMLFVARTGIEPVTFGL